MPIFRVKSVKIYTGQFFYTDTVCGVCDKYEVWPCIKPNKAILFSKMVDFNKPLPRFLNRVVIEPRSDEKRTFSTLGSPSSVKTFQKFVEVWEEIKEDMDIICLFCGIWWKTLKIISDGGQNMWLFSFHSLNQLPSAAARVNWDHLQKAAASKLP